MLDSLSSCGTVIFHNFVKYDMLRNEYFFCLIAFAFFSKEGTLIYEKMSYNHAKCTFAL